MSNGSEVREPAGSRPADLLAPSEGRAVDDRLRQASRRAEYLSQMARGLSGALHTTRAVDLVLERLAGPVADWAQVTLVEHGRHEFRSRDDAGRIRAATMPASAAGAGLARVLGTGATDLLLVPCGEQDEGVLVSAVPSPDLRSGLASLRPSAVLTLALTARGTTYGALSVARRDGTGFDDTAVAFLEDVAHQVSVTLDTTRALADSRRVAAVLAKDLNPPTLPELAGVDLASYYRVAFEHDALGGDFYDVHGTDEGWTAVMGDVFGKGVEAAVLTGKVRQSVRTAALVDRDPAAVLELVNRTLLIDSDEHLVTAVCTRGRREGDVVHLDIAAAGHPAPYVVRRDGSVEEVAVQGTVLGLLDPVAYTPVHVELAVGETCLFFTDGVAEAPGHRARFGDDRLRQVLEATGSCHVRAQVEAVAVAVSQHLLDRSHDDIAMLAIQSSGTR